MKRFIAILLFLITACSPETSVTIGGVSLTYTSSGLVVQPTTTSPLAGVRLELTGGVIVRADSRCERSGETITCSLGTLVSETTVTLQGSDFTACVVWNTGRICRVFP